jgi:hypothetical protein
MQRNASRNISRNSHVAELLPLLHRASPSSSGGLAEEPETGPYGCHTPMNSMMGSVILRIYSCRTGPWFARGAIT